MSLDDIARHLDPASPLLSAPTARPSPPQHVARHDRLVLQPAQRRDPPGLRPHVRVPGLVHASSRRASSVRETGTERQAISALADLADRSMLVAELDQVEGRYRMLTTLRDFAADKLAAMGEADDSPVSALGFLRRDGGGGGDGPAHRRRAAMGDAAVRRLRRPARRHTPGPSSATTSSSRSGCCSPLELRPAAPLARLLPMGRGGDDELPLESHRAGCRSARHRRLGSLAARRLPRERPTLPEPPSPPRPPTARG